MAPFDLWRLDLERYVALTMVRSRPRCSAGVWSGGRQSSGKASARRAAPQGETEERGYFLLPRLGFTPWLAFLRRARFLALTVRLDMGGEDTGRR